MYLLYWNVTGKQDYCRQRCFHFRGLFFQKNCDRTARKTPMIRSTALCVYMRMCSVLQTTLTECIQFVATQRLDVLTAYHISSSCILSSSHFGCFCPCVHAVNSHPGDTSLHLYQLNSTFCVICSVSGDNRLRAGLLRHCSGIRPRHSCVLQTSEGLLGKIE